MQCCLVQAAKINMLLCFMPIPYGSHPYLFSLTRYAMSASFPHVQKLS